MKNNKVIFLQNNIIFIQCPNSLTPSAQYISQFYLGLNSLNYTN